MDLELEKKRIKEHFNNITEEEFEEKLIKHGIEEINAMDNNWHLLVESEIDSIHIDKKYTTNNIYSGMNTEKRTFDPSDKSFTDIEVGA